jgi:hypothetical protein
MLRQGASALKFLAYDLTLIYADGVILAQAWRGSSLPGAALPGLNDFCAHPTADAAGKSTPDAPTVELTLLVASYGRENFFTVGQRSEVQKGIVGDVVLLCSSSNVTLTDWQVYAMPLVQPGRVLRWPHAQPQDSTSSLIASPHRLPFDSMHGGVWRRARHAGAHSSHELATPAHDEGLADDRSGSSWLARRLGGGGESSSAPARSQQALGGVQLNQWQGAGLGGTHLLGMPPAAGLAEPLVHGPVFYR